MIGYLRGRLVEHHGEEANEGLNGESIIFDVNGVGYELICSSNTIQDVLSRASSDIELWVHTHLREDALSLFGFSTLVEKRTFNSLLKVNGVGPKMAIKILSAARVSELEQMIESADVKRLASLPKVGKKTAEQLVLSLKGKLISGGEDRRAAAGRSKSASSEKLGSHRTEVLSALLNLGFRVQDVERVVADLPENVEIEAGVRQSLQAITRSI